MLTSKTSNYSLIPEDDTHNKAVLKWMAKLENFQTRRMVSLNISDENAQNGKPGSITACAAALCAKDYWGPGCRPSVKPSPDGTKTLLEVSDYDDQLRYTIELGIFTGGFDPEDWDRRRTMGLPVMGGPMMMHSVTVAPTRSGQLKKKKRYPRSDPPKTRGPRNWSPVPMKGERLPQKRETPQQLVMDALNGENSDRYVVSRAFDKDEEGGNIR